MFCKQCGNQLKDRAMFCTNCGAQQGAPATTPAPAADQDLEKTVGVFGGSIPNTAPVAEPVSAPVAEPEIEKTVGVFGGDIPNAAPVAEPVSAPVAEPEIEKTVGVFGGAIPNAAPAQPPVQQPPVQQPPVQQPPVQQPVQQPVQTPVQQPAFNHYTGPAHNGSVSFGEAVKLFFKNYVNFTGRASKSEFWWGYLFYFLISLTYVGILVGMIGALSLCIRRLHDIGKSWVWYLMGLIPYAGAIILIIYYCKDSDGDNQWGPGPVTANYGVNQFVNSPANSAPAQKVITDNDIYAMAQNHEPINLNSPDAKQIMDRELGRIVPTYTGFENLAGAMMLCDPQTIKNNIAATDTDTLLVIFKALGYYIGQGGDTNILGMVQQNVLSTLKTRF